MKRLTAGILIFPDVDVLDFTGPFEVLSRARTVPGIESRRSDEHAPFHVCTVSQAGGPVRATGGLTVVPDHTFATAPTIDVLVVPGGFGTRPLLEDAELIDWIARAAGEAQFVTSVCTGALLLAKSGVLRGRRATTHYGALALLKELDPTITVERDERFVDDGVITSAGVSAGLDMALHLVERIAGPDVGKDTAKFMDYRSAASTQRDR